MDGSQGRIVSVPVQYRGWIGRTVRQRDLLANSTIGQRFGQTFGYWGWKPNFYLMIPLIGPSNDRDGVGLIGDAAANPQTYFSPYNYASYGINYNNLTGSVMNISGLPNRKQILFRAPVRVDICSRKPSRQFQVKGEQDKPSLETLQSVCLIPKRITCQKPLRF